MALAEDGVFWRMNVLPAFSTEITKAVSITIEIKKLCH